MNEVSEKKLIGFTPHPKQREILYSILKGKEKYHIVSVGRQFGKSLMGMNLALWWGVNNSPCKILWVAPVYSQTTKVQKEIYKSVQNTGLVKVCNFSDNIIELVNGSEIIFRSAERYDNIRGYTFDYGILDEAAFMKEQAWQEAIRPTLSVRGKKVLFLSTPKGKNWFYKMYNLGKGGDNENYKSYRGSSFDTPFIDEKEILDAEKTLPRSIYEQEYLATFINDGGEVFTNIKTFSTYPQPEGQIYCGIDLGRQVDYSVALFMDSKGRVIDTYRNNKSSWGEMVEDISKKINKYEAITLVEVNSIGDVIYEQLKNKVKSIYPFVTSNKSKQEIIEGLILDFNSDMIHIPSQELFSPLYNELNTFTYQYSQKTRSIKYGAPEGLHDDCVMSLALTNYCRKTQNKKGKYNWIK